MIGILLLLFLFLLLFFVFITTNSILSTTVPILTVITTLVRIVLFLHRFICIILSGALTEMPRKAPGGAHGPSEGEEEG